MNESLKNTYNTIMEVPAASAPPFLPGKGSCFWESGRKSIGSEKVSGSIGLLMEVLYVGISCSVDIWCTDEYSRRF